MVVRLFYISFILAVLIGCTKKDYTIDNLNDGKIEILGHAGMGIYYSYPTNSLESLVQAVNSGGNGTEMDLQLSKDSALIIFHDTELSEATNLSGKVIDFSLEEIRKAHYTSVPFSDVKIGDVETLFSLINPTDYTMTFDCKLNPAGNDAMSYKKTFARQIKKVFDQYSLFEHVIVESSNTSFISEIQALDSTIRILYYPDDFESGVAIANSMNLFGITISTHHITKDQMKLAHDAGLYVAIWNMYDKKDNREAVEKNPDMIQTDKLHHLIKLLE